MREFTGRVAVVTGAGSGIGLAMAERLAAEGMKVVLADMDELAVAKAAFVLTTQGYEAISARADVTCFPDVQRLAELTMDTFGTVHLVCNNAGVDGYRSGRLWEAADRDWAWSMGVNFYGAVHGIRAFVPLLLKNGTSGHLVNTVSTAALIKPTSVYGISKHAVLALTEALDEQLRADGADIGVTALCPGHTLTSIFAKARTERPDDLSVTDDNETAREDRRRRHAILLEKGVPPGYVADKMIEGIRTNALYVVTDSEWDEQVRQRWAAIMDGARLFAGPPR